MKRMKANTVLLLMMVSVGLLSACSGTTTTRPAAAPYKSPYSPSSHSNAAATTAATMISPARAY